MLYYFHRLKSSQLKHRSSPYFVFLACAPTCFEFYLPPSCWHSSSSVFIFWLGRSVHYCGYQARKESHFQKAQFTPSLKGLFVSECSAHLNSKHYKCSNILLFCSEKKSFNENYSVSISVLLGSLWYAHGGPSPFVSPDWPAMWAAIESLGVRDL
jgi:hypothetical protein